MGGGVYLSFDKLRMNERPKLRVNMRPNPASETQTENPLPLWGRVWVGASRPSTPESLIPEQIQQIHVCYP